MCCTTFLDCRTCTNTACLLAPIWKRLCNVNIRNSKVLHPFHLSTFFSKNLLGYLETLVAFCPYYRADDAQMVGKMEAFYQQAVQRYKEYTDKQLHQYITRKLTAWCHLYRPKPPSTESADNEDIDGEEGDVVDVAQGYALGRKRYELSEDEDGEEESAAPAAGNAAAPAAAAPDAPAESGSDGAESPAAGGAIKA